MKKVTIWFLICLLGVGIISFSAMANTTGTDSEITVIRYEELSALLEAGNFSLKQSAQSMEDAVAPYRDAWELLRAERKTMEEKAEDYEDEGNTTMQEFYETHAAQLKSAMIQIKTQMNRVVSRTTERAYEKQKEALTLASQTIFLTYKQLSSTLEAQEKSLEAANASYQAALRKQELGLMKSEEVAQAKYAWQAGENAVHSMKEQMERLKKSLLTMLGLENETNVELGEMPVLEESLLSQIDLEADKALALSYDSTYIQERRSTVKGTEGRKLKQQRMENAAATAEMGLISTYETLCQKQILCEGNRSSYEAAYRDYQALLSKQENGLISQIEFLQGEAQYLMSKADWENASRELYQAYENYCWEVRGIK